MTSKAELRVSRPGMVKAVILDIEGTTTPISFVLDVLFPYAERQYKTYITQNWDRESFQPYKDAFAAEDKDLVSSPETLSEFVQTKHAKNEKHTAFKSLQGAIWKSGYEDGSIRSILYEDVPKAMDKLHQSRVPIFIYSSGSVPAQKLLFQYSDHGDLTPKLKGYFDTSTAGPKVEASSYRTISGAIQVASADCLFLSDNVREVEAAKDAGLQSWIVERPGNADLSASDRSAHRVITSFQDL